MEKNSSSWPSRETQELDLREEQVEEEADMAGGDSEGGAAGLRAAWLHPRPRGNTGPVSKIDPILPSPSPQPQHPPLPSLGVMLKYIIIYFRREIKLLRNIKSSLYNLK